MKNGGQEEVERKNFGVNQFQNVRYGRLAPAGSHNRVGRMKNLAYPFSFYKGGQDGKDRVCMVGGSNFKRRHRGLGMGKKEREQGKIQDGKSKSIPVRGK